MCLHAQEGGLSRQGSGQIGGGQAQALLKELRTVAALEVGRRAAAAVGVTCSAAWHHDAARVHTAIALSSRHDDGAFFRRLRPALPNNSHPNSHPILHPRLA